MYNTFPPLSQSIITTGDWVEPSSYNELFRKSNAPAHTHLMPTTRVHFDAPTNAVPDFMPTAPNPMSIAVDTMPSFTPTAMSAATDTMPDFMPPAVAPPMMEEDEDSDSEDDLWQTNNLVTTVPPVAFSTSMYPMEVSSLVVPQP